MDKTRTIKYLKMIRILDKKHFITNSFMPSDDDCSS